MNPAQSTWSLFVAQLRAERKKAAILGVLALVMVVVFARAFLSSKPAPAEAGPVSGVSATPGNAAAPAPAAATPIAAAVLPADIERVVIAHLSRTVSRDLFDTDLRSVASPAESAEEQASRAAAATQPSKASVWWHRLLAGMAAQARRSEAGRAAIESELAKLTLQGTILGPRPKAYISGRLVREGEIIGGFRLLNVFPRHVTLHKSGCNVRLTMP